MLFGWSLYLKAVLATVLTCVKINEFFPRNNYYLEMAGVVGGLLCLCMLAVVAEAQPWFSTMGNNQHSFSTFGDPPMNPAEAAKVSLRWSLTNISTALQTLRPDDYKSFVSFGPALSPDPSTLVFLATKWV